jgi:predicted nucleic acid-binding Zn ribbon protein
MIQSNIYPQFFNFKTCPVCGGQFKGRRNKQYCSADCKTRYNNELARERRQDEQLLIGDYLLNYKLLEKLLQMNGGNPLVIGSKELGFFGFKSEAPSIRTKIDGVLTYVFQDIGIQPSEAEQITRIFRIP